MDWLGQQSCSFPFYHPSGVHAISYLLAQSALGSALTMFAELAEEPWDVQWWRQVFRFALRLKGMGSGVLHKDILLDNVRDAQANPAAGNWACQLILRAQSLGMPAPFDASGSVVIDAAQHRDQALQRVQRGWDDTHISLRSCPSVGAKLCTYHRRFSRPNPQVTESYFELPLSRRSLGQLFRFRSPGQSGQKRMARGSLARLPCSMGREWDLNRNLRAKLPRAMRFCPLCPGYHVGDERHLVFECPALQHIRQHYADIYSDAHSTMRLFMWHKDQKAMASCLLRLLSEYDSLLG